MATLGTLNGCIQVSAAADLTGASAAAKANTPVGTRGQAKDTGKNYVLVLTGGARSWVLQD